MKTNKRLVLYLLLHLVGFIIIIAILAPLLIQFHPYFEIGVTRVLQQVLSVIFRIFLTLFLYSMGRMVILKKIQKGGNQI